MFFTHDYCGIWSSVLDEQSSYRSTKLLVASPPFSPMPVILFALQAICISSLTLFAPKGLAPYQTFSWYDGRLKDAKKQIVVISWHCKLPAYI